MNTRVMSRILAGVCLVGATSLATAGDWEVWTEKRNGDRLVVATSFAGDAKIEDAQIDLKVEGSFEVISVETLHKDAVCVASAARGLLRSLPPSGAGTPLAKAAADTCVFTLRVLGAKTWEPEQLVKVEKTECASSYTGLVPCEGSIRRLK